MESFIVTRLLNCAHRMHHLLSPVSLGVFTVDSNGSLRGRLRKQLRLFCCMRFRFEKATQTDFNFDRTEFQTVLKAAELEIHSQIWQLAMLDLTNPDHSQFKFIAYVLA